MTGADSIGLLRRISATLTRIGDPDGPEFAAHLAEYVRGAQDGVSLGDAFGFKVPRGVSAWWEQERLAERNELIRAIARQHFRRPSVRQAANELTRELRRYESGAWLRHRAYTEPPAALRGTLQESFFALLKLRLATGESTVRDALASDSGVYLGHASADAADRPEDINGTEAHDEAPTATRPRRSRTSTVGRRSTLPHRAREG